MTNALLSILVLLVGAAAAVALRSNRAAAVAAISTQGLACGLMLAGVCGPLWNGEVIEQTWAWAEPVRSIVFHVDALSAFFLAWSLPMTLLGTIYAVSYLQPYFASGRHGGPHYALLNVVSLSFVIIYSAQNALVFLLGWEIAAVAAWLLVIWDDRNQRVRFAGFNYLVSTHVGLFVLSGAFMLLHSNTGSFDFARFGDYLSHPSAMRATIFTLLGIAFGLKSAFFPFHTWLPRAHAAAPAHVSALMSGVIHKAGLFAFLRFTLLMGTPEEWMGWSVLAFGGTSAFFGVLFTTTQRDLKRLLGYSSTENVGIAAMGFGVGYLGWCWGDLPLAVCGFTAGLLHILNHAVFKCLLFYAAGAVYRATHSVDLERLGGIAKRMPLTAALFLIGALAIAALPPLNGFVSELILYSGLLSGRAPDPTSNVALVAAAALLAFVGASSALAITRAFGIAFLGHARDRHEPHAHDPPLGMLMPMITHALSAIALGLLPTLGILLVRSTVELFPFSTVWPTFPPLSAATTASRWLALAMVALGVLRWWQTANARRSETWGCGNTTVNERMQYSGSSMSELYARHFVRLMPSQRRETLPSELFPRRPGHLSTHHPDPVERRMFEVISRSEGFVTQLAAKVSEEPRFAFAGGFIALVLIGALVFGAHP